MLAAYLQVVRLVQLFVAVDAAFVPEPWPARKIRISFNKCGNENINKMFMVTFYYNFL